MFHIIKLRKIWYAISLILVVISVVSLSTQGLNLGIDFTGGNIVELKFKNPTTTEDVRNILAEYKLEDSQIQSGGENDFFIRTRVLSQEESDKAFSNIGEKLGGATILRNELVGPVVGKELTQKALLALAVASVLILIYISWRFEFWQGVSAFIGLLHDALIMVGLASVFQIEIDSSFVAAVLTVIGYSIHDSIIIFDRIRENLRINRKEELTTLINKSLWQTMARSINTVLTVVFVLLSLFLLGGSTIHSFVALLLIGIVCGAYSSIFTAGPLWYDLRQLQNRKKAAKAQA
ncbi:protein translocase subunit SecF [Desulforamulus ruminis]|uniref:Protein-export membrane protein SecF n=1 Tax=Desulforamulus ruminis (strain ATCC 23193 / DSM 2154 / NCIMB 8452 / DL) TaxID=696281 RepID=F6DN29_DESRL|nr:protein translocase subunit SecF [Desulforamulus ruminis]AEG60618.1 protein-export membrane protein SecF [Desulforamulus ruminis DSM 2154]